MKKIEKFEAFNQGLSASEMEMFKGGANWKSGTLYGSYTEVDGSIFRTYHSINGGFDKFSYDGKWVTYNNGRWG